jgi:hypothetical protein
VTHELAGAASISEASPSLYLGLSLGLTFPFDILFVIPLDASGAQWLLA